VLKPALFHGRPRRGFAWCALLAAFSVLGACSHSNIQNPEAVKQAVLEYLNARAAQTGLNMDVMDLVVTSVTFQKDEAQTTILFKLKNTGQGGMSMNYTLDRKGDKWVVRGRQDNVASPHGGGATPGGTTELPPDHPSVGVPPGSGAPSGTELPPGHPGVGSTK